MLPNPVGSYVTPINLIISIKNSNREIRVEKSRILVIKVVIGKVDRTN